MLFGFPSKYAPMPFALQFGDGSARLVLSGVVLLDPEKLRLEEAYDGFVLEYDSGEMYASTLPFPVIPYD
jgi:hypothetical protein